MIPIIIPAYEPDERLICLIKNLIEADLGPIVVVDDGSGEAYNSIFQRVENLIAEQNGCVLIHDKNRGKGRALKTAFSYVISMSENILGCVTADSDGQHTVSCISKVKEALEKKPDSLVLGVRKFNVKGIPWKSRVGNVITRKLTAILLGIDVCDTQTGLRGIPTTFMEYLQGVSGERFEFEMQMLVESVGRYPILEVPVQTIYESESNHQTHFNPLTDSIRIYQILVAKLLKFGFSSVSSACLDLILFAFFSSFFKTRVISQSVAIATILARIISSVYNYLVNYFIVFKGKQGHKETMQKYYVLACIIMIGSAVFTTFGTKLFSSISEVYIKVIVDGVLFFASYYVQQFFVFSKNEK